MKNSLLSLLLLCILFSCADNEPKELPILGKRQLVQGDTVYHEIPDFAFLTQDNQLLTNEDLKNNIYLSDFFFANCPTICPRVKKQMLRIYNKYEDNDRVKLVSHTVDPKRDTPERLKAYAGKLNVDTDKWIFLTGNKDSLHDISALYFNSAFDDPEAPGGFNHSGYITLVDTKRHIRSYADGTDPEDVDKLLKHIDKLLLEYEKN